MPTTRFKMINSAYIIAYNILAQHAIFHRRHKRGGCGGKRGWKFLMWATTVLGIGNIEIWCSFSISQYMPLWNNLGFSSHCLMVLEVTGWKLGLLYGSPRYLHCYPSFHGLSHVPTSTFAGCPVSLQEGISVHGVGKQERINITYSVFPMGSGEV